MNYSNVFTHRILSIPAVLGLLQATSLVAQTDVEELGRRYGTRPPPAYYELLRSNPNAFRFSPENGWIKRARRVAETRNRLRGNRLGGGVFLTEAAHEVDGIVRGDVFMPVFLVLFSNSDSAEMVSNIPRSTIETRLYGTDPAPPYSVHTYYREVSNDSVRVYGTVFDWTFVSGLDTYYEGDNNGLNGGSMGNLIREIAAVLDDTVDFGQFDNDGPDGIPNTLDDDGYVDAVVLIHPEVDGSCGGVNAAAADNIWAHRFFTSTAGSTNDVSVATGGSIQFRDYIVQGGQGGDGGCTDNEPVAMGVVGHETGHLFGLPDLYDTGSDPGGAGIGRWGIMGSGNHQVPTRPVHLSAFSKAQLGWVNEVLIESDTTLEISPVETSDTVYVLPVPNTNEYFLLENRQRIGSDTSLIYPGLLIFHVDSNLARLRGLSNTVNAIDPYAVAVEQADGRNDLMNDANRGDITDPFPGNNNNQSFGRATSPSSLSNSGVISYVELDSIAQVTENGPVRVRVGFERPMYIAASDTNAVFRLDGVARNLFDDYLTLGVEYTLEMDSLQVSGDGRSRFVWLSWSNGLSRSHSFIATLAGDSIIAEVDAEYEVMATASGTGSGTLSADVSLDLANGTMLPSDSVITLVATVDVAEHIFEGWQGSDTTATADTLVLRMSRPFTLDAVFAAPLTFGFDSIPTAVMGTEYSFQLTKAGGITDEGWLLRGGTLPAGIEFDYGGLLSGTPEATGTFSLTIEVESGSQGFVDTVQIAVEAPVLVASDVLQHLVGAGTTLSENDLEYLDLLGNRNGSLDVGDVLGWVNAGGPTITAQEVTALLEAVGRDNQMERPKRERSHR